MSIDEWLCGQPDRCAQGYAEVQHPALCTCDYGEWDRFVRVLRTVAAEHDGTVDWTHVRPLLRGRIYHKHIGQLTGRAKRAGLLIEAGVHRSRDELGKNAGRYEPVYRLVS